MSYIKPDSEYHQVNDWSQLNENGYELIIDSNGNKWYYFDGLLHRENTPAIIEISGYQAWLIHDKYHRLNGPAKIFADGAKRYFINDKQYEENEFWIIQKKCFKCHQEFNNFYDLKAHLEQYDDSKNMIEYIFKLLLG